MTQTENQGQMSRYTASWQFCTPGNCHPRSDQTFIWDGCLSKWPLADAEGKNIKIGQIFPGVQTGLLVSCCDDTSWSEAIIYILCLPGFTGCCDMVLCNFFSNGMSINFHVV